MLTDTDLNIQGIQVKYSTNGNCNIPATESTLCETQSDTTCTCLVPKFACCVAGPSEFFIQQFSIERSRTASPDVVLQRAYPNGPKAGREAGWESEFVPLKKREVGIFILLHKISWTACCFGIRTFLKQYSCYESATIWYTDHQYLSTIQRNNQQSARNTSYIL